MITPVKKNNVPLCVRLSLFLAHRHTHTHHAPLWDIITVISQGIENKSQQSQPVTVSGSPQPLLNLPIFPWNNHLEFGKSSNLNFQLARSIIFIQFPHIYGTILGSGTEGNPCTIGFFFTFKHIFLKGIFF